MYKKFKKVSFIIAILLLLTISSSVFAATVSSEKAKFEVVENNVCTINIQDVATFEKKMISYDLEKKEVDIQLKVTNTTKPVFNKPTEIAFLIDNSLSMRENYVSSEVTRMDAVTTAAKKLATSLLESDQVKISVTSFSSKETNEGTIEDAMLRLAPSNNSTEILAAIDSVGTDNLGPRTNIEAGLTVASTNYTSEAQNKYLVLLTDGVPNLIVGRSTYIYSGETATVTKAKLLELKNKGITVFTVMAGVNSANIEQTTGLTYGELAEEIFGTETAPTTGKFYNITDSQIDKTISETVLKDFGSNDATTLTNLKIYDYFPQQIVDNFDFSYVTSPTKGTISQSIDLQNNLIIWTIDSLEPEESVTVTYKLKLKSKIDEKISGVVLNTNEKVEITADQVKTDDGTNKLVSTVSPKVRVTLPKDETVAPEKIPQTGITDMPYITSAVIICAVAIIGIGFYIKNKDVK